MTPELIESIGLWVVIPIVIAIIVWAVYWGDAKTKQEKTKRRIAGVEED